MKNKRKIRIPAAAYGLNGGNASILTASNSEMAGLGSALNSSLVNKTAPNNPSHLKQDIALRKGQGADGFANFDIGAMASAASGGIGTILGVGAKSEATTGKEAVTQSLADINSGVSAGAKFGSAFGPLGTAIGGAIGGSIGLIGRKGQSAEMTSFTDYDEGTLGTGLIGAFGNRGLRRRRREIKKNAYNNRAAVQGTDYLQGEVYDDMIGMNSNAMANGGISSSPAYVDDGELLQTPEGTISKVPERGKPTDSNLVNLQNGTKVLSDKLKVPGRKETFAQLGEKMIAKKKSKYNDIFAENAAKLNEMNNNMIYDQLFNMQESLKESKGIKPKTKQIQTAALGDEIKPGLGDRIVDAIYNPNRKWGAGVQWGTGNNQWYHIPINTTEQVSAEQTPIAINGGVRKRSNKAKTTATQPQSTSTLKAKYPDRLIASNSEMAGIGNALTPQTEKISILPRSNAAVNSGPQSKGVDINWGSVLSDVASLAPIMSNLFAGKPETVDAVYNPYATSIMNTMRGRRYDITPAIEDLNRNRATSNYNASQFNTNTGANLAYRLQSAVNADRAIANVRSQESNINNQYLADYANTMNSLGQQWVNATNIAADANAQNRAASRNINRTGISQLSQWAQNRELMRNQRTRDEQMWHLYERFLQAGFTNDDLQAFMNSNRRTLKNRV